MKCKHCNAEWNAPNATSVVLKNCPFCGQSLIEKEKKLDSLEAVLTEIIDSYGVDVLRNGKNMLAFLSDLAPSMKKEKKLLTYLIECGGHTQILNSLKNDPKEQKICVENVIYTMHDQLFLEKAMAQTVCYTFFAAVSGQTLETVMPKSKPAPTPVEQTAPPKPAVATPTPTAVAPKPAMVAQAPSLTPEEQYQKGKQFYQNKYYKNAFEWYKKAAEQGHSEAQNSLGNCYYNGQGVNQDYTQAVYWYQKAAEQGDADAQSNLGWFYENGQGVSKDLSQAAYWYKRAINSGSVFSQSSLERVERAFKEQEEQKQRENAKAQGTNTNYVIVDNVTGKPIDMSQYSMTIDPSIGNILLHMQERAQNNIDSNDLKAEKLYDFKLIANDGYAVQLKNSKSSPTKATIPSHYRGKAVIQISEQGFEGCYNLISIEIPANIKTIGFSALKNCFNLREIVFKGTKQQWSAINKGNEWKSGKNNFVVRCSDGDIPKFLA